MQLSLRKPRLEDSDNLLAFRQAFQDAGQVLHGASFLDKAQSIPQWLAYLDQLEDEARVPDNLVPSLTYIMVDDKDKILGIINLRLKLNDYLANIGGHVGYAIHPHLQGMGFGKQLLSLILPVAKNHGLLRLLVTADEDNLASQGVILANGGVFADKRQDLDDQGWVKRYWIATDEDGAVTHA